MKFRVVRPHQGDRWYNEGDERDAKEHDVTHLVANGVLEKMAEKPKNKMAKAPKNKAV